MAKPQPRDQFRAWLANEIRAAQYSLAQASRLVSRDDGYLHSFVFRARPRKLPTDVANGLASMLGVSALALERGEIPRADGPENGMAGEVTPRGVLIPMVGRASSLQELYGPPISRVLMPMDCPVNAVAFYAAGGGSITLPAGAVVVVSPSAVPRVGDIVAVFPSADLDGGLGSVVSIGTAAAVVRTSDIERCVNLADGSAVLRVVRIDLP